MIDFICIGANKSGTTWLYEMVRQHPEICVSKVKEPHFYSHNYDKGYEWYFNLWKTEINQKTGEFSTTYFNSVLALDRIVKDNPDVKIVLLLRDPLSRAYSHLKHLLRENTINNVPNYIQKNPEIYSNSYYNSILNQLYRRFKPNNLLILQYEKIIYEPEGLIKQVFKFLKVSLSFKPEGLNKVVGKGYIPKHKTIEKAKVWLYFFLKNVGAYRIFNIIKSLGIAEIFKKINSSDNESLNSDVLGYIEPYKDSIIEETRYLIHDNNLKDFDFNLWSSLKEIK